MISPSRKSGDRTDSPIPSIGGETDSSKVEPWAPGGAMAAVPSSGASTADLAFTPAGEPQVAPPNFERRRWLIGGAVFLTIGVTTALFFSDGGVPPSDSSHTSAAVEPAESALPEVSLPLQAPASTLPLLSDAPLRIDRNPTERLVLAAAPREFVIELAPELAGINPTEVVALQGEDGLYEVSLPSGRVRVTDLGFFTGQTQLVATDQAAVIWPTPEGGAQIVSTQRSVAVPEASVDRVSWSPGTNRFYLWAVRSFANGYDASVHAVDVDGAEIQVQPADWVDNIDNPAILLDFDGRLLRSDTGGTFGIGPNGAELLTPGDVVANGPNHLLLRECNAVRACRLISVSADGERREWPIDLPDGVNPQRLAGLSPWGDALLVINDRLSADVPSALQVLELTDGTLQSLQASPFFEGFASWDTSGAGVFYADQQLLYFDRFTGERVVVSEDLPRLSSVRTRRPADSPTPRLNAPAPTADEGD